MAKTGPVGSGNSSLPVGATDPAGLALGNSQASMKRAFGIGRNAGDPYVDSTTNPWESFDGSAEMQTIWNNESKVSQPTRAYNKTGLSAFKSSDDPSFSNTDYWDDLEAEREQRMQEAEYLDPDVPAPLSDIPTSSTNYRRPRTVAAGWAEDPSYPEHGTLTVVFRDGTVYNFYDVPHSDWIKFHSALSKGKSFLNKPSGTLLTYPHGPADLSRIDPRVREMIYRAARSQQLYWGRKLEKAGAYRFLTKTDPITGKVKNVKKVKGYTVPAAAASKVLAKKQRAAQAPKRNRSASKKP